MSAADRHARVQELFDRVCDLTPDERRAVLAREDDELSAEVLALVESEERAAALESPAAEHLGEIPVASRVDPASSLPERVGDYEVIGVLGEGGMGIVYEAQEKAPRRRVALKLIREGFVTEEHLRRFQREAEALALIEHPGVARIYAAGAVDVRGVERPFIAMELVRGESIIEHADRCALDHVDRLRLVAQLLEGVHHAHGRGVVHRDLKPANVLVNEAGEVKVLDFGIARIADPDGTRMTSATEVGQVLGTLAYMSPEQVDPQRGEPRDGRRSSRPRDSAAFVDMRADVYAVGVIAYELLSGKLPFDVQKRSIVEAARVITEEDPTWLGRIDTRLRGDVNWIVHKALSKERNERYGSAEEFRRDIERFLDDEPVLARPPSSFYQLVKFTRRNRGLVVGIGAAFLTLMAGLTAVTILLSRTSSLLEQRDEEVAASDEALAFMEALFAQTDPLQEGDISLSQMATRAAEQFQDNLKERQVQRARLLNSIGKTMIDLDMRSQATPLLDEALKIRAKAFGDDSVEYAQTLERVARLHQLDGRHGIAYEMQARVLAIRRKHLGPSELTADALSNLGATARFLGREDEDERLKGEALEMLDGLFGARDARTLTSRAHLVAAMGYGGRAEEALPLFDELIDLGAAVPPHVSIQLRVQKAWSLRFLGRLGDALVELEKVRELAVERYGESMGLVRTIDSSRAMALSGMGRAEEAVAIVRGSLERAIESDGLESMTVASLTHDLAYVVHDLPSPANGEAEGLYRKAIQRFEKAADASGGFVYMARHNLALWLERAGRLEEALAEVTAAYEGRRTLLGLDNQNTLASLRGLAGVLATMKRHRAAADRYGEFVSLAGPMMGESSWPVQTARLQLAAEEARDGNLEAARGHIGKARGLAGDMHDPSAFMGRIQRAEERFFPSAEVRR